MSVEHARLATFDALPVNHKHGNEIHAIAVRPALRRKGAGRQILAAAAQWAAEQGADRLALAVTQANSGAIALYTSLGMQPVGEYHYRIKV